jgi:hypothetical protein
MVLCQLQKELVDVVYAIHVSEVADKESMDQAKQLLAEYSMSSRNVATSIWTWHANLA